MAAQRHPLPEPRPERPALRLVPPRAEAATLEPAGVEVVGPAFHQGLLWGIVISTLGFWLPVGTALYLWLT